MECRSEAAPIGQVTRAESLRRTAAIGRGAAGLTAAYVLSKARDVTLHGAGDRLARTHELTASDGRRHRVDTGFIVHNHGTHPKLLRLLHELDVGTQEAEMSRLVRCEGCGPECVGARCLRRLLAHPRGALRGWCPRTPADCRASTGPPDGSLPRPPTTR